MGPTSLYSAMRGEAKHKYFTTLSSRIHNSINLCKTLAKRHQQKFCHYITHFDTENYLTTGKISKASSEFIFKFSNTLKLINYADTDSLFLVTYLNFFGHFRPNLYISVLDGNILDNIPIFHKILHIVQYQNKYYLLSELIKTICFDINKNAFQISKSNENENVFHLNELKLNAKNKFNVYEEVFSKENLNLYLLRKCI